MKKFLLFLLSLLFGIGLFLWVGRFVNWQEIKKSFLLFTGWKGLIILILTILITFLKFWRWKTILQSQGYNTSNLNLGRIYLAAKSISFIAPIFILADEIFMIYTLREKNSIPGIKGATSIIIDKILYTTGLFIVVSLGLIFFLFKIGFPVQLVGVIFGLLLFLGLTLFFFYFKSFKKESLIKFFVRDFSQQISNHGNAAIEIEKEVFDFFGPKKKAMWKGFGLTFFEIIAGFVRCWALIVFLGKSIDVFSTLSILGCLYIAFTIPIPAALGSHEAIQTFAFNSLGLKTATATAFTMIVRAAESIVVLVGLLCLFQLGTELLKISLFRKIEEFFDNKPR